MKLSESAVELVIRDADPAADAASCATIYTPYVMHTTITFEEQPPAPADFEQRIAAAQVRHAWLIGEVHGVAVGYAYAGPYRPRAAYRWSCETSVYLDRDRRGTGVGRQLYQALLDRMTELGFRTAVAGTTLPNDASQRLHDGLGFEPIGVFRAVGFKFDQWCDVAWVQRDLGA
ncbi:MAG: N-acetyltransferase family protein [Ornithinimicrobium sp.]